MLKSTTRLRKNKDITIIFEEHALKRHKERFGMQPKDTGKRGPYFKCSSLEREIKRGNTYLDPDRNSTSFYINYNNLKVYKGELHTLKEKDGSNPEDVLRVRTVYPYRQKLRGKLVKCEKVELSDYF